MYFSLFFWLSIIGLIVWLVRRSRRKAKALAQRLDRAMERLTSVEHALKKIEGRFAALEGKGERPEAELKVEISAAPVPLVESASVPAPPREEPVLPIAPVREAIVALTDVPDKPIAAVVPPRASGTEQGFRRMERLFIENWTGILGVVVLVAGVTFIGIYMAFRLEPFSRFLMTVAAAAALFCASLFLRRTPRLRSIPCLCSRTSLTGYSCPLPCSFIRLSLNGEL